MHYDLADLRLFAAIAEEANLTRGAGRAHLAPSSASHRLARLEESLGTPLFERHARGLRLTRAGETLLSHARQVFAQLEQMHADLAPFAHGVRAQVTVAANTNATSSFLPDDLGAFLRREPQVRVSLRESTSPGVMRAVAGGEADIGVCAMEPSETELELRPYRCDRWLLALPPDHPLARRRRLRFRDVWTALRGPASGSGAQLLVNKAGDWALPGRAIQVGSLDASCAWWRRPAWVSCPSRRWRAAADRRWPSCAGRTPDHGTVNVTRHPRPHPPAGLWSIWPPAGGSGCEHEFGTTTSRVRPHRS